MRTLLMAMGIAVAVADASRVSGIAEDKLHEL